MDPKKGQRYSNEFRREDVDKRLPSLRTVPAAHELGGPGQPALGYWRPVPTPFAGSFTSAGTPALEIGDDSRSVPGSFVVSVHLVGEVRKGEFLFLLPAVAFRDSFVPPAG